MLGRSPKLPSSLFCLHSAFPRKRYSCAGRTRRETSPPPRPEKSLIGAASVGGGIFLVAQFAWRKNIANGCILRRPCFCNLGTERAISLFPDHCFWPDVRRRVAPGQLLFRKVNSGNANRTLKAISAKLAIPEATRYSSHGFRRGAAQELKDRGSPWAAVATAGLRNSEAFRGYADMPRGVETSASRLFAVDPNSDSGCEPEHMGSFFSPWGCSPLDRSARPLFLGYRGSLGRP